MSHYRTGPRRSVGRGRSAGAAGDAPATGEVQFDPGALTLALNTLASNPNAPIRKEGHNSMVLAAAAAADFAVAPGSELTSNGVPLVGSFVVDLGEARRVLSALPATDTRRAMYKAARWAVLELAKGRPAVMPTVEGGGTATERAGGVAWFAVAGIVVAVGLVLAACVRTAEAWLHERAETAQRTAQIVAGTHEWQLRQEMQAREHRTIDPGPNEAAALAFGSSLADPWTTRLQAASSGLMWAAAGVVAWLVAKGSK